MNIEGIEYNNDLHLRYTRTYVAVGSAIRIDGIGLIGESWLAVDGMDVPNDGRRASRKMERRTPRVCHDGAPSLFVKA